MQGTIRGTATYRERIALPPGAVLEVTLEDVSRADAPADVVGRATVGNAGNPPIAFAIPYDPARIDPDRSYTVRARITVGDRPWFATDRHYPVLTRGAGSEVELLLRRAQGGGNAAVLEATRWKLIELNGEPAGATQTEPHLVFDPSGDRVTGSGGCNSLTGGYALAGETLIFGQMATTMMACAQGMETERTFHQALGRARGWRIAGGRLELLDAEGRAVARFDRGGDR